MKRHMKAFTTGEDIDEDSGCLHIGMLVWNALTLMWFQLNFQGTDDRFITYKNEELMIKSPEDFQKQIDMFWKIYEEKVKEREAGEALSRK